MGENSYSSNSKILSYYKNKISETSKMRIINRMLISEKVLITKFIEKSLKVSFVHINWGGYKNEEKEEKVYVGCSARFSDEYGFNSMFWIFWWGEKNDYNV